MSNFLLGCTVLGETWEKPFVVDDKDWGAPVDVTGHGGHGGGHGGHGHGGGGRGFGGFGFSPWLEVDEPVLDVDDFDETVRCVEYDADGKCTKYVPTDVLGDALSEIIGMFDFNVEQKKMNALKTVPVSVAQALLKGGMAAINGAIAGAKQPWYKADLPGDNSRKEVLGKLQWHQSALASLGSTPNAIYASGDDLKHWVTQSFVEANAVEEGAQYMQNAWNKMWDEIATAIKNLPAEVRKQVGNMIESVTGLPVWAWALIGVGVIVLIGGMVYLIINSKAGAAAAHALVSKVPIL